MTSLISKLSRYTTCDISDALLKLKVPHGGILADLVPFSPVGQASKEVSDVKIIGEAYTVKMTPLNEDAPKLKDHYVCKVK